MSWIGVDSNALFWVHETVFALFFSILVWYLWATYRWRTGSMSGLTFHRTRWAVGLSAVIFIMINTAIFLAVRYTQPPYFR